MPAQVTLGHEPVEWISPFEELREAIWDDDLFVAYLASRSLKVAFWEVHRFHRVIANQLIERGVTDPTVSDWATRTVSLNIRIRVRRRQVQRAFRAEFGNAALSAELKAFARKYPRAVAP